VSVLLLLLLLLLLLSLLLRNMPARLQDCSHCGS
jgi:hypothetical protein